MPNWCDNRLVVSTWSATEEKDEARKQIKEFLCKAEVVEENGEVVNALSMNNLYPMPKELEDTKAGFGNDKPNWYDWRCDNWGTKWDVASCLENDDIDYLEYSFQSAWRTPTAFLEKVSKDFPLLRFVLKYEEEGMGFLGRAIAKDGILDDACLEC